MVLEWLFERETHKIKIGKIRIETEKQTNKKLRFVEAYVVMALLDRIAW